MARVHMLGRCPVCGDEMEVTRLYCPACRTSVEGRFETCKFCHLSRDQMEFLETFIRSRGNIKEVEREMGISYPTVRNRLDNVIRALGFQVDTVDEDEEKHREEARARRMDILGRVAAGELTAEEAAERIRGEK